MRIHQLSADDALASLHSRREGLTTDEARIRRHEFGPNQIDRPRGEPIIWHLVRSFTHFLAIILWLAAGLAFVAEQYDPGFGMATLGAAIVGVIVINGVFSFWQEYRAERALTALEDLLPRQVIVQRDGAAVTVPATEIVPGDIVLLEEGDAIPADLRIIQAFGLRVNLATVTGESVPVARDARADPSNDGTNRRNLLLAGTTVVAGRAEAVVYATGMATEFGKISRLSHRATAPVSPLQLEIARVSRRIAILAIAIGVAFFGIGQVVGVSWWSSFVFAIGVIVANVPEGLLPTVTLALAIGSQRMARRKALIRHLPSVETLGAVTVICTDKTGTLTLNRMAVRRVVLAEFLSQGDEPSRPPEQIPNALPLWDVARHCHDLKASRNNGPVTWLGDPMEVALLEAAHDAQSQFPRVDELPFDTDRKRLSTLHETAAGMMLYTKGAAESVLPLCTRMWTSAGEQPLTDASRQQLLNAQDTMGRHGLRVLALAQRAMSVGGDRETWEADMTFCGLVGLEDPLRPEVPAAVRSCHHAGIRVIMITGDHPQTALAIAHQAGLTIANSGSVITGDQLRRLTDSQLRLLLRKKELIFARVGADQKLRIVEALRARRDVVAVTGDGVNDAPALRAADIGIAMGCTGTDVARAAADMVLLDDNFATIVAAVEEGRGVYANIRKFLTYILASNVPELVPYLAFVLLKIPLALTVIQILAVDLGTDLVPALGLGAEPPEAGLMRKPPRSRRERLLTYQLLARAYFWLGLMEAVAAMAAFFFVLYQGGWVFGQSLAANDPLYRQATTACLGAIIVMQMANVFLCRSDHSSIFQQSVFSNRLILFGIATEIILIGIIVYTPIGHTLFGTAPLDLGPWLFMVPFALAMVGLEELRKLWVRRRSAVLTCPASARAID